MNEHMPECPVEKRLRAGRTVGSQTCICAALRACETRVEESMGRAWSQSVQLAVAHTRTATLDAAREAVSDIADRWDHWIGECVMTKAIDGQYINRDDAVAAIDALREERQ